MRILGPIRTLAITLGAVGALSFACGTTKDQGSLVVALETDVRVPDNVDGIGIAISVDKQIKYSQLFSIDATLEKQGLRVVKLPATIAVLEPAGGAPAVQVRAVAFWHGEARIVRDVISTVPHGRTALLRVPLAYLGYDDGVTGSIPRESFQPLPKQTAPARVTVIHLTDAPGGTGAATDIVDKISSRCSLLGLTNVDGECVDPTIDSATLPDYAQTDLFPNGVDPDGFANPMPCFDMATCFDANATITHRELDRTNGECKVKLDVPAADLNIAMLLDTQASPRQVGFCPDESTCLIPMSRDDAHGFRIDEAAGLVHLPRGVCERPSVIKMVLAHRAGCAQKTALTPIDGAGTNCSNDVVAPDAGADAGADADAGPAQPWWSATDRSASAAAVAVTSNGVGVLVATTTKDLYYVTLDKPTGKSNLIAGPNNVVGLATSALAFVATADEFVYTTFGTSDAIAWTLTAGASPFLGMPTNLKAAGTSGIIDKTDKVMNPVTNCLGVGGVCFPAPNRTNGTFPYRMPNGTVTDQSIDIMASQSGAFALSAVGADAYGAFYKGSTLGVGKVDGNSFSSDATKAFAIATVPGSTGGVISAVTVVDSRDKMVHLGWVDSSTNKLTISTTSPAIAPADETAFMHTLAGDANSHVYFTDINGDLWSWNALAPTAALVKVDPTPRVGSYGVAVDGLFKVVYRAFTGDATTPGGVTRSLLTPP